MKKTIWAAVLIIVSIIILGLVQLSHYTQTSTTNDVELPYDFPNPFSPTAACSDLSAGLPVGWSGIMVSDMQGMTNLEVLEWYRAYMPSEKPDWTRITSNQNYLVYAKGDTRVIICIDIGSMRFDFITDFFWGPKEGLAQVVSDFLQYSEQGGDA